MKPTKYVKSVYDCVRNAIRTKCSGAERLALRHIVAMEISGCIIGLCMLLVHFFSSMLFHKNIGLHFFEHLSSVDSEFILSGLVATGFLFMQPGWFLEEKAYQYVVKPWLGLLTHSSALFAGVSVPVGIGEGFSKASFVSGFGLAVVILALGNLLAVFFSLLSIGANPKQLSKRSGVVDGLFKTPMLRFIFGFGTLLVYGALHF